VDLGTGDGSAVVRWARIHPDEAVLGIDADMSRMREASARAGRPAGKGGLPNAWFAVAPAEALPTELDGRVDELRIVLPWGSLLRGALGPEPWFHGATSRLLRPDGTFRLLVSVTPRDSVPGVMNLDAATAEALGQRYEASGWTVIGVRHAEDRDVAALGSSWAKRLGIPSRRGAVLVELRPPQARSSAA
jgi:hypothetical protein